MYFKSIFPASAVFVAFTCLIGCSNMGSSPISVSETKNPLSATVGTNGAMAVAAGGGQVWAIGKDLWSNGKHKVYRWNDYYWMPYVSISNIDAIKISCDHTGAAWVIGADLTLWKYTWTNWEQQMDYNGGSYVPVLAHDVAVEPSTGYIDIISNTKLGYGYQIRTTSPSSNGYWWPFYPGVEGTGIALAIDPRPDLALPLWVVRDNHDLMKWECPHFVKKTTIAANDVAVGQDGYVYFISNEKPYTQYPNDYQIYVSTNGGSSWISACALGVSVDADNRAWTVNSFGTILKHNGNPFIPGTHLWDAY